MEAYNKDTKTFLSISVYLTGYDEMTLLGTGMLESYYNVMIHENSIDLVSAFLATSTKILAVNSPDIDHEIEQLLMNNVKLSGLTKNIIMMWYTGNWNNNVISAQSYIQGLVWKAADTHPPGAKQPGYASWQNPPIITQVPAPVKSSVAAKTLTIV
ncbi:hypothetical protein [Chitinophaga sp. RAB17]|uniref:hypothetical protein n=1 Tax=Chitinophaga sp. RAB17 TaxID=3233049 RepID=UPI003F92408A